VDELSPRQERILEAVVVEYVLGAEPVSSELVVSKYGLGVRGATVRNEMAEITGLGLLEQPYASAGRRPSDSGYRYYVDRLVIVREPEKPERRAVEQAASEDTLFEVLESTTRALARMTHLLSVGTIHRQAETRVRHALLSGLGPGRCLLVLVLDNGHIENRLVDAPGADLAQIGALNDWLATECAGKRVDELLSARLPESHEGAELRSAVGTVLRAVARGIRRGRMVAEGHEFVLAQPEFRRDETAAQEVLESLEDEEALREAVQSDGISIGSENPDRRMRRLTVIRRPIVFGGREAGALGLVGPTRMRYDRSISLLDYAARALSKALDDLTA
jgi:heat-inducible transcriptional repressor